MKEVLKRRKALAKRLLRAEILEPRQLLASDWQNPLWKYDVDDDGTLSPLDVLVVINKINSADPNLDFNKPVGWNPYFDVDADRTLSPLDVLSLINRINQAPGNVTTTGSLLVDSGLSNTDRISNDPTIVGSFNSQSGLSYTAKAR
ncbi:MAG: dockerin type I domain-containing protein, partial [Pirellula sp.]